MPAPRAWACEHASWSHLSPHRQRSSLPRSRLRKKTAEKAEKRALQPAQTMLGRFHQSKVASSHCHLTLPNPVRAKSMILTEFCNWVPSRVLEYHDIVSAAMRIPHPPRSKRIVRPHMFFVLGRNPRITCTTRRRLSGGAACANRRLRAGWRGHRCRRHSASLMRTTRMLNTKGGSHF